MGDRGPGASGDRMGPHSGCGNFHGDDDGRTVPAPSVVPTTVTAPLSTAKDKVPRGGGAGSCLVPRWNQTFLRFLN